MLYHKIDEYIRDRIVVAGEVIQATAGRKIKDGDVILTFARYVLPSVGAAPLKSKAQFINCGACSTQRMGRWKAIFCGGRRFKANARRYFGAFL